MRRMNADSYDYAGRITSMFGEMGSTISTALYSTISGTGNGAKNLIGDLCNSILKMWADMITQMYIMTPMRNLFSGLLSGMFGGGGGGWLSGLGSTGIFGFASGGVASGWSIVGERGPELANFTNPARIYTASDTRAMMGGGSSAPSVQIQVVNQTGTQAKARQQSSFDSETNTAVISIILEALESDTMGLRTTVGAL